ncbi:MAG TPA: dicarboxylate/amino acid:cation symporter, partial [Cyanobacteria bacterium UBA9579]|nr:dicarboxylate/amino acid:cation symporter [Cyanobacteria bacterium UBA9579]
MSKDGTAIFQTISILFIAHAYGVPLEPLTIIQICFLAIIASSSTAGIPSAGLITMTIILNGLGLTPEQVMQGFALLFAIDRFLDMFRTLVNVTSETVIASIIAAKEGELDYDLLGNQEVWKEV